MKRREAIRMFSAGVVGGAAMLPTSARPGFAQERPKALNGLAPVKIRDIKTILTAPDRIRLVVVKIETTEPGLYGLGCATFTQRAYVVETAIEKYLKPFLIGRNVDEIEDIWQSSYMSSYWRNGPVLFNALSGV
ncbi:MAG: starvation-sensing protein RspA, partial [Acidobacteria bacterium]|nr:starvation-sensing protein RspA [Acidobacteriota bacterium]